MIGFSERVRIPHLPAYVVFVTMLTHSACRSRSHPAASGGPGGAPAVPAPRALVVEWAGCASIRKGPICELGPSRKLTLWLPEATVSRWTVFTDRLTRLPPAATSVDGGTQLTVDIPVGTRAVQLKNSGGATDWTLATAEAPAHEQIEALVRFGRTGKYREALNELAALRGKATPAERGPLEAAMGRMALGLGDVVAAEPHFRAAIAAASGEGRLSDVVKDGAGLFWGLVHLQQRYSDARAVLQLMAQAGGETPEGRVWLDYHAGFLAADTADVRTAMDRYRRAGRAARRIELTGLADAAATEMARLLTKIGRPGEALQLLAALSPPKDSCARATYDLGVAWAWIEREVLTSSAEGRSERARAIARVDQATKDCPDPHRRMIALTYAAEEALLNDDPAEARRFIRELEGATDDHDALHASRRAEVLGRWYLQQGRARTALKLFDKEIPAARAGGLVEEVFRAEVGAGRALLKLGNRKAAVSRLELAQSVLETALRGVPLGEGRGGFLSGRDEGVRYLVAALVEGGAIERALRTVRVARSAELNHAARLDRLTRLSAEARRRWDGAVERYQTLRAAIEHDAEQDWTVPGAQLAERRAARMTQAEEARAALDVAFALLGDDGNQDHATLSQPGPGEIFLAFFPWPPEAPGAPGHAGPLAAASPVPWFALAATDRGVVVRTVEERDFSSRRAAERVLALFNPELVAARRIRLFPYGVADQVDWQTVRWRGEPLLALLEVEYGLDVGPGPRSQARPSAGIEKGTSRALVVSNPTGDLAAATPEARLVVSALADWEILLLDGAAASRDALLGALPQVRLFHYAGHAQISAAYGLSTSLVLGGNTRVELGDLLAAPTVPELVVLPACQAAGALEGGRSAMGLAQAFIAAGSRAAIAPVRPVGDQEVAAFVASFYVAFARVVRPPHPAAAPAEFGQVVEAGRLAFRSAALAISSKKRNGTGPEPSGDAGCDSLRLLVP